MTEPEAGPAETTVPESPPPPPPPPPPAPGSVDGTETVTDDEGPNWKLIVGLAGGGLLVLLLIIGALAGDDDEGADVAARTPGDDVPAGVPHEPIEDEGEEGGDDHAGRLTLVTDGVSQVHDYIDGKPVVFDAVIDAGNEVSIEVSSNDFDPEVELFDSNGTSLGSDDDSGGGTTAFLQTIVTTDGFHTVEVRGVDGNSGSFSIVATAVDTSGRSDPPSDPGPANQAPPPEQGTNLINKTVTIDPAATQFESVSLKAGDKVRISAFDQGDGTDPEIFLIDPGGTIVGDDDDSGGGSDAELTITVASTGNFNIAIDELNGIRGDIGLVVRLLV